MADVKYGEIPLLVVDLIDNPKIADTEAPTVAPCQLETTGWSGVSNKLANGVADASLRGRAQSGEFFLSSR
jgi:hypothetical protein